MAREPDFFRNTHFLIDGFHAKGHTRCSKACSLSYYKKHDNELADLNSSAAECGNAGIGRIRKSLSYMTQHHAIIYTWVYLAVWNRERRLDLRKTSAITAAAAAAAASAVAAASASAVAAASAAAAVVPTSVAPPSQHLP